MDWERNGPVWLFQAPFQRLIDASAEVASAHPPRYHRPALRPPRGHRLSGSGAGSTGSSFSADSALSASACPSGMINFLHCAADESTP